MVLKNRNIWARILPILITALLVCIVFRGFDVRLLKGTLSHMKPGWFLSAIALYGFLFLPAAWRWHLVLKLAAQAKSFRTTLRFSLIGHFFYTILFGVVGGDSAKAVVYARRHDLSPQEILATAPLDRLLGLVGSLVFAAVAFGVAMAAGAFAPLSTLSLKLPLRWWMLAAGMVIVLVFAVRTKKPSAWTEFAAAFSCHATALLKSPRTLLEGSICGLMVQTALSGVLALNLCGVSTGPIDWQKLAWTFPLIVAVSALPITVSGLGTREGIAAILWGLYGVPKADAIAASLLTLTAGLLWAGAGALLLWNNREKELGSHWRVIPTKRVRGPLAQSERLSAESI